jgi:holo-[acyl-carrier protein] synthase
VIRVGVDLVSVSRVAESLSRFGERFAARLFTDGERAYAAQAPALTAERLAARFAAKEAVVKALGLSETGASWRDIEVHRTDGGQCELRLHGPLAPLAASSELALSLSHEGDLAAAVVVVQRRT